MANPGGLIARAGDAPAMLVPRSLPLALPLARLLALALLLALGCGGPPTSGTPNATSAPSSAPRRSRTTMPPAALPTRAFPSQAGGAAYKWVLSQRLGLRFALPDRPGWVLRRVRSRFLLFDHAASSSHLAIALWTGDGNMNQARCEERARLYRDLPKRSQNLSTTRLERPGTFNTRSDVGVESRDDGSIRGTLLAIGASGRRCFVFAFETEDVGEAAEEQVAARLATMHSLTLEKMQLRGAATSSVKPAWEATTEPPGVRENEQ